MKTSDIILILDVVINRCDRIKSCLSDAHQCTRQPQLPAILKALNIELQRAQEIAGELINLPFDQERFDD
jgi:hypothetical protein